MTRSTLITTALVVVTFALLVAGLLGNYWLLPLVYVFAVIGLFRLRPKRRSSLGVLVDDVHPNLFVDCRFEPGGAYGVYIDSTTDVEVTSIEFS